MKPSKMSRAIPLFVAFLATASILWLLTTSLRSPGFAERPLNFGEPTGPVTAGARSTAPASAPTGFNNSNVAIQNLPGSWPGFRGPNGDNISPEKVPLAHQWGAGMPRPLWSVQMGEGYAAAAIDAGRVFVLDYDQAAQLDSLRCFSLADGSEIWRRSTPDTVKRNHGMSRTIPAVHGKYVVGLGPKCNLVCADTTTGKLNWQHDLVQEYGVTVPEWYAGQCPLIDGEKAIIAPCGTKALMVAFDLATGKPAWQTPNTTGWQMTHVSISATTFKGQKMYVYCGSGGVAGVMAKDGKLAWQNNEWTVNTAAVPSPLSIGDGRLLLTGGYGAGAAILQISEVGGQYSAKIEKRFTPDVFGSDQHTPILYGGNIYGVRAGGELVCMDLNGKILWSSGAARFGLGPYMIADGLIYLLNDSGILSIAEASPLGYKQLGQAQILSGPDAWGPLALAGGRLIARDLNKMVCLDVSAK